MAGQAAKMVRETSTAGEPGKTARTVNPTENEIATVAYRLWLNSGCPPGSELEHWLRAEAILRNALTAKREDPSGCPSPPRRVTGTGSEMVAKFGWERWEGHWEIWEREWGARWVWDVRSQGARVSNRAALTRQAAGA
jgi:hypothetical protein